MKAFIPFGDWSEDGHGHCEKILVDVPSLESCLNAQIAIKEKYGKNFFDGFAQDYETPTVSPTIAKALSDMNYKLPDGIAVDSDYEYSLAEIEDMFINLLNHFGAGIVPCTKNEQIIEINNWTCRGFETVGYGCWCE